MDGEVGVFRGIGRLRYVQAGGFVGVIWWVGDVEYDCRLVILALFVWVPAIIELY